MNNFELIDILPVLKDGDSQSWMALPGRGCAQRTLTHPGFIGSRLPRVEHCFFSHASPRLRLTVALLTSRWCCLPQHEQAHARTAKPSRPWGPVRAPQAPHSWGCGCAPKAGLKKARFWRQSCQRWCTDN